MICAAAGFEKDTTRRTSHLADDQLTSMDTDSSRKRQYFSGLVQVQTLWIRPEDGSFGRITNLDHHVSINLFQY